MKKIFIPIFICLCLIAYIVGYSTTTTTTNLSLVIPASGDTTVDWFDTVNANFELIDDIYDTVTLTEFGYLDGVTSAIQTQLDSKAASGANSDITSLTGLTTPLGAAYGGTGIANNAAETITIGGAGTFPLTLTLTAATDVTLPTTGTVAVTANKLSDFAATTSAELAGVISDETGTGKLVFDTSPTLVTPLLGTPTSGVLTNCTGLPTEDQLKIITVDITAQNILDMYATPVTIIAAPGAGKITIIDQVVFSYTYGGTAFAEGGLVVIKEETSGSDLVAGITQAQMRGTVDILHQGFAVNKRIYSNRKMLISNLTATYTTGNGTMKLFIRYRIVTL